MKRISQKARKCINGWLDNIQEGDKIVFDRVSARIYSNGCENDSVPLYQ